MSILIHATEAELIEPVVSDLRAEGLDVQPIDDSKLNDVPKLPPDANKVVLIVPKHGAGEPTARLRKLLTDDQLLILCSHQTEREGSNKLRQVGANAIITPRSWLPHHISERILGQLIVDGDIPITGCGEVRGATQAIRNAYSNVAIIAPLDEPILITGETGTGKDLFARAIHNISGRPDIFLPINCGTLIRDLAGSELFGCRRGAFTGAVERRGLFLEASAGTVFLDEIGDLDLQAQVTLLRVLEEKKVRRVGSNQNEDAPARVLLATHRDLELQCEQGTFRQDLFERIRGFTLELPPLRKRRADIPLLAAHFLDEFRREKQKKIEFPLGAVDYLFTHDWPGNIRELRAAIRRAAVYTRDNSFIDVGQLIQAKRANRKRRAPGETMSVDGKDYVQFDPRGDTWKKFSERARANYFRAVLDAAGGDRKKARSVTGLGTSQFYEVLKSIAVLDEIQWDLDSD